MGALVLGRHGQLASHLRTLLPSASFWGRDALDLERASDIAAAIIDAAPSCIVNATAYTDVDRAESEPLRAWRINVAAVVEVARAAAALDVPLVQVSSDYVFDGRSAEPYRVGDAVNPLSVYGKTKLAGEIAVATLCPKHRILRTSWMFSEHGSNFVKTILRLGAERDVIEVVDDQLGVPTYAGDLAAVIAALVEGGAEAALAPGIYHAVGGTSVTWCEFSRRIVTSAAARGLIDRAPTIAPISTAAYAAAARRPAHSVLAPSPELAKATGVSLDWERGLERALEHH